MKIIKKANIKKPQTCEVCGTTVKLKLKDLESHPYSVEKALWICPVCRKRNTFNWEENSAS